MEGIMCA